MLIKIIQLCLIFLCGLNVNLLSAQETVLAAGGNASGNNGSVSYSVGQVFYTTNTGTNGSVAQGIHQPFEISVVSGIEQAKGITMQCSVYPNPATDYLILKIEGEELTQYVASLYDINGKLLEIKRIEGNETSFVMLNLVPATYFLKVTENNKKIKTFKIIKN